MNRVDKSANLCDFKAMDPQLVFCVIKRAKGDGNPKK